MADSGQPRTPFSPESSVVSSLPPYRLPETVVPERYDIRLEPDLPGGSFTGEETIAIEVREATSAISVNARDLQIDSVAVRGPGGASTTRTGTAQLDEPNEMARLRFAEPLAPGTYNLQIRFRGSLKHKGGGFFLTPYRADDGGEALLASTQFQAVDARRSFPCWDEPAFKAVFGVTLVVDEGLTAVSNGGLLSETPVPGTGKRALRFADTPRMSSYLVAYVVGKYAAGEAVTGAGVPLCVWALRGREQRSAYARAAGKFALDFFAGYYGIPYPGDKVDMIAIPGRRGAMENFGCVTFGEIPLLLDERTATHAELVRSAELIAHELGHLWFGDLVTMRWWNGIWLNEAFARFVQVLCVDAWRPEWERWEAFGSVRQAAMLVDGLTSARPTEFPVGPPEEAWPMFDVLTYEKGASVLRMLEQYLGPEVFRDGVGRYLRRHAFGSTEAVDLWAALAEASGVAVGPVMDSWILQPGYPLVGAELTNDGTTLRLSQERFLYLDEQQAGDSALASLWHVPVRLRVATGEGVEEQSLLLDDMEQEVELPAGFQTVVVNAGGHGYYRTHYAPGLLSRLLPRVQQSLLAGERVSMVSDTWAETVAGRRSLTEFLDFARLIGEEEDPGVLSALLDAFAALSLMLGAELGQPVAALVRERLRPLLARIGWSARAGESPRLSPVRAQLITLLGTIGDDLDVRREAAARYERHRASAPVDANIVPALISVLAAAGDERRYDEFWRAYREARTPQDEERYLVALTAFRQEALLARTLAHAMSDPVNIQEGPMLIRATLLNPFGSGVAWRFLKENWQAIEERFAQRAVPRLCEGIVALTTPEHEADVIDFFATHPVKGAGKHLEQYLERLRIGVRFRQREAVSLVTYVAALP